MIKRGTLIFIAILLIASSSGAEEFKQLKPSAAEKCPVCGMFVAKYPDWLAQITFKDGSQVFFDGVKDMMKYYFNLAKYNPKKKVTDIAAVFVTEYYSLSMTDGFKALYVVGSNVYGPMGRELIPFKDEAEAKEFMKDHAGESLVVFSGITPQLIQKLD
ncbi:MAG: nitrous oxide reductase accessory protein NosL [Deltaproteobacteria bacterium RBG_13_58_19]|nr:MAG: nitrous oxide reductase accessory protein NosL [Deltaproteobacteria bacterium RBG_13_58_19]